MHTASESGREVERLAAEQRESSSRRRWLGTAAGVGIAAACVLAWPWARAHLQSVAVMRQVEGEPVPAVVRGLTYGVASRDLNFPVELPTGRQMVRARMYEPAGWTMENHPHAPAMAIFHGVHNLGIDEPRLMGFASAMASCGIRVLTPELPGIKDYHVSGDSVEMIGESVEWLARQTGRPAGVMGLSFSGGLALVAAENKKYAPAFKFVLAVGAHDSMERVAEFYQTGRDAGPDGLVEVLTPHEYGPLVLEYAHLDDFVPAADLAQVRAVLRAHLYEDKKGEAEASLGLTEAQRRETKELMDAASPEMRARIVAALEKHMGEMAGLSPDAGLAGLHVPVYLLHGAADNIIPSAESKWIARGVPEGDLEEVLISPVLSHVDVHTRSPGAMDEWRLVDFFGRVIEATEKGS